MARHSGIGLTVSRRHVIDRRLQMLADIRGIMDSIKTLAHMETQRLAPVLPVQQLCVQRVRQMAADFASEHALPALNGRAENPLLIVIGAERGLCGDFNKQMQEALEHLPATAAPRAIVCLGTRLGQKLEGRPGLLAQLSGATIADDVPAVIRQLLERCAALQSEQHLPSLALLYHGAGDEGIRLDPLLSPFLEADRVAPRAPLLLNLEPQVFVHGLLQQYLH
ncbi:MAG: F0F1 ATP synthase subunit gamma, partial [Pseudomonadales bacterium]